MTAEKNRRWWAGAVERIVQTPTPAEERAHEVLRLLGLPRPAGGERLVS